MSTTRGATFSRSPEAWPAPILCVIAAITTIPKPDSITSNPATTTPPTEDSSMQILTPEPVRASLATICSPIAATILYAEWIPLDAGGAKMLGIGFATKVAKRWIGRATNWKKQRIG